MPVVWYEGETKGIHSVAPLDDTIRLAPALPPGGLTQKIYVFYRDIQTEATGDQDANDFLPVLSTTDFAVGDTLEVVDTTKARQEVVIDTIPSNTLLGLTTNIGVVIDAEARVIKKAVTGSIAGTAYGTQDVDTTDWGYVAWLLWTLPNIWPGQTLLVDIVLDDAGSLHSERAVEIVRAGRQLKEVA